MFRDKCAITIRRKQYKNDKGREEKKTTRTTNNCTGQLTVTSKKTLNSNGSEHTKLTKTENETGSYEGSSIFGPVHDMHLYMGHGGYHITIKSFY